MKKKNRITVHIARWFWIMMLIISIQGAFTMSFLFLAAIFKLKSGEYDALCSLIMVFIFFSGCVFFLIYDKRFLCKIEIGKDSITSSFLGKKLCSFKQTDKLYYTLICLPSGADNWQFVILSENVIKGEDYKLNKFDLSSGILIPLNKKTAEFLEFDNWTEDSALIDRIHNSPKDIFFRNYFYVLGHLQAMELIRYYKYGVKPDRD